MAQRDKFVDLIGINKLVVKYIFIEITCWGFYIYIPAQLNLNYFFIKIIK